MYFLFEFDDLDLVVEYCVVFVVLSVLFNVVLFVLLIELFSVVLLRVVLFVFVLFEKYILAPIIHPAIIIAIAIIIVFLLF